MSSNDNATLGEVILAGIRGVRFKMPLCPANFVKESVSRPGVSRPAGSVALDFTCDLHGGRLMRLWMAPEDGVATFGGEGVKGAWGTDTNDRGATNDWLVARLRQVEADFDAGKGLPIAWFPLSKVGAPSR
jgi:hypothetical protein